MFTSENIKKYGINPLTEVDMDLLKSLPDKYPDKQPKSAFSQIYHKDWVYNSLVKYLE